MTAICPTFSVPSSLPHTVYTFSWHGAFKYAPCMSADKTSILLKEASSKEIRTLSRETTLAYVCFVGGLVTCPPATNLALRVKSIFTSNTRWHGICCCPIGASAPSSRIFTAGMITFISLFMASCQSVVLVLWSSHRASCTVFGSSIPNFCSFLWYIVFIFEIILSLFFSVNGTHHLNTGL
jgi:hypothetical protein